MNANHILTKKGIAFSLGAAAAPAFLLIAAATAHADADPTAQHNGTIFVWYTSNPAGLTAKIEDEGNRSGTERCHYHAVGIDGTPPLPYDADAFPTGRAQASLFIPSIRLGGHWAVTVTCDNGGTFNFEETY